MKKIKLFETFHQNNALSSKVMAVATPEQKKVLDDFQTGTEFLFLMSPALKGDVSAAKIDDALRLMANEVEGDISQLEPEHAKYAEAKGWLEGFNENDKVKLRKTVEQVPTTLGVAFGEDQVPSVEKMLSKLKEEKHVTSWKIEKGSAGGDLVHFTIEFTSQYGVYLFGHMQGSQKHF